MYANIQNFLKSKNILKIPQTFLCPHAFWLRDPQPIPRFSPVSNFHICPAIKLPHDPWMAKATTGIIYLCSTFGKKKKTGKGHFFLLLFILLCFKQRNISHKYSKWTSPLSHYPGPRTKWHAPKSGSDSHQSQQTSWGFWSSPLKSIVSKSSEQDQGYVRKGESRDTWQLRNYKSQW